MTSDDKEAAATDALYVSIRSSDDEPSNRTQCLT